jgi:hypothetical protein
MMMVVMVTALMMMTMMSKRMVLDGMVMKIMNGKATNVQQKTFTLMMLRQFQVTPLGVPRSSSGP